MARGDIADNLGLLIEDFAEDGTAAITKGDLCLLRAGKTKKIVALSDPGPYGVAVEDIAKSATGRIALRGIIYMDEGNDAPLSKGDIVIPSGTTVGDIKTATTTNFSSNYVASQIKELRLIVGMALDALTKDGSGRILLGPQVGLSD